MTESYSAEESTFKDGVRCYVCPDCAFTFDAVHTDDNASAEGEVYTCPLCEANELRGELADQLLDEAETARLAPNGQHPKVSVRTHAAALRFAADLVRTSGEVH